MAAVCLDGDEIFSLLAARQGWWDITLTAARDSVHPPLFYYLLHVWRGLGGESLVWLRLLPVLISIAAIVPLYLLCRELNLSRFETSAAMLLFGIDPYLVYYAQHVRMYSLLLTCSVVSLWLFCRILRHDDAGFREFAALTAANIVLVYAQYYGWLLVAIEVGYLLLWGRRLVSRMLVSVAVTIAAFSPWLYLAAKYAYAKGGLAENLDWIARPGIVSFLWLFVDASGCAEFPVAGVAVAAAILGVVVVAFWQRRKLTDWRIRFLLVFTAAPAIATFAASYALPHSVWGDRHLVFIAAPLLVLCAVAFCLIQMRLPRAMAVVIFVAWIVLAGASNIHDDKKLAWDSFVVQMAAQEERAQGPITFYSLDPHLHFAVWFYLKTLSEGSTTGFSKRIAAPELSELSRSAARFEVRKVTGLAGLPDGHFWLAYSPESWGTGMPRPQGCRSGTGITGRDRFHTVRAFPVWCEARHIQ